MVILYDIIFIILFILYCPVLLVRKKLHRGYKIRFGFLDAQTVERLRHKTNIWFHAVSVGEVLAIIELIKKVRAKYPSNQIVLSTVTETGYELAHQNLDQKNIILFAPLDISFVIKKFVTLIKPKIYIAAETEIWPNLYRALEKAQVPIIQVNGRISDDSFKGYQRIKWLIQKTLKRVSLFCMQSELDAKRAVEIGAPQEKVCITGNIKFDNLPTNGSIEKKTLGYKSNDQIFIAGSTHANEEEIILNTIDKLRHDEPSLKLIISPRDIERASEIKELVESKGYNAVVLSEVTGKTLAEKDVLIVDQIGVLKDLYSIATVVFIGKSLAVGGGQNMIEPAFFGKATIVGTKTYNFKDVVRIFVSEGALIQVNDENELFGKLKMLMSDDDKRKTVGENARKVVEKYQGATTRTFEHISRILK